MPIMNPRYKTNRGIKYNGLTYINYPRDDVLESRCPIDDELCDEQETGTRTRKERYQELPTRECRHGKWNRDTDDPPCRNIEDRKKKPIKSKSKRKTKCKCK